MKATQVVRCCFFDKFYPLNLPPFCFKVLLWLIFNIEMRLFAQLEGYH